MAELLVTGLIRTLVTALIATLIGTARVVMAAAPVVVVLLAEGVELVVIPAGVAVVVARGPGLEVIEVVGGFLVVDRPLAEAVPHAGARGTRSASRTGTTREISVGTVPGKQVGDAQPVGVRIPAPARSTCGIEPAIVVHATSRHPLIVAEW